MSIVLKIINSLDEVNITIIFFYLFLFLIPTAFYFKEKIFVGIISSFVTVWIIVLFRKIMYGISETYIIFIYYYILIVLNFIIGIKTIINTDKNVDKKEKLSNKKMIKDIKIFCFLYLIVILITTILIIIILYSLPIR